MENLSFSSPKFRHSERRDSPWRSPERISAQLKLPTAQPGESFAIRARSFVASASQDDKKTGFTLIELSIVLVIIGLIVGGILLGRDLIKASEAQATITQIQKYNAAVNTFRNKYGGLPGDLQAIFANQFGFIARGTYPGQGDGNGIIEGNDGCSVGCNGGIIEGAGETGVFWIDLSTANLIEGQFNTASITTIPAGGVLQTSLNLYFPPAKLGGGNYVYVWSSYGTNYFEISNITGINPPAGAGTLTAAPNIPVQQAYNIDLKIDDGLPRSGSVMAQYTTGGSLFANVQVTGSSTSCMDYRNGGYQYSIEINGGANLTCALSFRFQ
jgi:prepilin-type N-terminal cleavage/methylation domain-containing protein